MKTLVVSASLIVAVIAMANFHSVRRKWPVQWDNSHLQLARRLQNHGPRSI